MSQVAVEVVFIVVLVLINGVFSMSEIAVVSSRKTRLQQRANEGDDRARAALKLVEAPAKFLATVQIGITLVGILAGAFGGATIAEQIADYIESVPALAPYGESIGLLVVVVIIAYFSLVVGELVPKQLGLHAPERIAISIARPMLALSRLVAPVVSLLSFSTRVLMSVLRVRPSTEPEITEEEIKVLIGQGTEIGIFERVEQDMVERVFRLGDLHVDALITPRTEMISLDLSDTADTIYQKITADRHSRYPVVEGSIDRVVGIVEAGDLLRQCLSGSTFNMGAVLRQPVFVPETTPALKALQLLRDTRSHMALVIDEYGGLLGLITINSLLEKIITDAFLPFESEAMAIQREDGSWLLDGLLPIDELISLLNIRDLMEDERGYQTMGGFIMTRMERIPTSGDHFVFGRWRFEIVDMDGRRVDKVLVTSIAQQ
ncbi:MAG: hemolysin family protein [Anaerolineae bacterium]|nr:hemolysin family protein [Anaerolineae bacterium]